jgi:NADH-quinone oxidoreductase subunit J
MELVIFLLFAVLALAGSLGVVLSRNPVHCALSLVLALVSVAVFFLQQDAQLLAAVQVIVYAGAVVVLFLFVIMLLGVDREETLVEPIRYQRPAALALGGAVLAEVLFLAGRTWATGASSVRGSLDDRVDGENLNNIQRVARTLFTDFLWPFEITAALLVIAVVGGVVLARRSGQPVEILPEETDEGAATGRSLPSERATAGGVSPPAASERK